MINLDPGIVDQNKVRKQKRKQLFRTALIPIIVLVISAIIFLRPGIYNVITSIGDNNSNFRLVRDMSSTQASILNFFESYIADYNMGVSNIRLSNFEEAEKNFESALSKNPPESMLCKIYVNLSYSVEAQADKAANSSDYERAIELYNRSESLLYNNNCASNKAGVTGSDQNADSAKARIDEKRQNAAKTLAGATGEEDDKKQAELSTPLDNTSLEEIRATSRSDSEALREVREKTGQGKGIGSLSKDSHW
jgi:tetratricopeptide (TPR) repeat protein